MRCRISCGVQKIQASDRAFAAILRDGSVVTWTVCWICSHLEFFDCFGGCSRLVQQLKNVQQIQASNGAFAAILGEDLWSVPTMVATAVRCRTSCETPRSWVMDLSSPGATMATAVPYRISCEICNRRCLASERKVRMPSQSPVKDQVPGAHNPGNLKPVKPKALETQALTHEKLGKPQQK